jgi:hypothetical protein
MSSLPPWVCPFCYQQLELDARSTEEGHGLFIYSGSGWSGLDGLPVPGDMTVCTYCGELCVLALDRSLRRPAATDHDAMNDIMLRDIAAGIKESIARGEARARREQGDEFVE